MSESSENNLKADQTLDPIRPSISLMNDEVSYLYGRDPSILAYGQRPGPSAAQKKNLLSLYEVEESVFEVNPNFDSPSSQTVKVYLRLKPLPKKTKLNQQQQEAYSIIDSHTLLTKIPNQDCLSNSTIKSHTSIASDVICRRYTFTETFGPETTQNHFFDRVVKTQMQEFLTGSNATIMAYGTTNSGKTFTLQGTTSSPGIIPRGLEYVFSQINAKSLPNYKPVNNNSVIYLTPIDRAQELDIKNKLLAFSTTDRNQYINTYKQMQKLLKEESPERTSEPTNAQYAVWVSFAEIYNESIYDLLSNDTLQKNRSGLKLMTDNNGAAYIKGLKSIFVTSGSEAFQVLMAGQYNLKVAATALNARSSRSHCIFTIKLLKYFKDNDPESVEISTFSFCDLAGSERLKKTLNVGDRLKEAQNINTSLLVLGRCLKSIYEGQTIKQRNEHVGPFRESKLTRLFQRPLSGKEPIVMIVNANPVPNLYVETQNVLNFAAIAKKIVLQPKKPKQRKSKTRFSQVVMQTKKDVIDWEDPTELDNIIEETLSDDDCNESIQPDDYEDLLLENERLKKEIELLKSSAIKREMETREEMAKLHDEMVQRLEQDYMSRIEDVQEQQQNLRDWEIEKVEKYYEEKMIELTCKKRKRSRFNDDDNEDLCDETEMKELMLEIENLSSKVLSLKSKLKEANKDKETAIQEKNTMMYHLSLTKEQLKASENLKKSMEQNITGDNDFTSYIEEIKVQLDEQEKKNCTLKERLNEARQEYLEMENELERKDSQIQKLKNKLVTKKERIEDLEHELDNVQEILDKQTDYNTTLEKKMENLAQQLIEVDNKRYDELKEKYDVSIKEIEEMKSNIFDKENKKITELQEKLAKSENENHQLIEKLSQSCEEIESLKEKLTESENENHQLNEKLSQSCEEIESLKEKLTESENENHQLNEKLSQSCEELESLKEKLTESENENHQLNEKLSQSCEEIESLKEKLTESENENHQLNEKLSQSCEELESLKEKLAETESENDQLNGKLSQKREEIESLKKNLNQVMIDTAGIQEQLKMLNQQPQSSSQTNLKQNVEIKKEVTESCDSGCQTSFFPPTDQSNQTSFTQSFDDKILQTSVDDTVYKAISLEAELDKAREAYDELEHKYEQERSQVALLNDKMQNFEVILQEKNISDECLQQMREFLELLKIQVDTLNNRVDELEKENEDLHRSETSYSAKLIQVTKEIDLNYNKCQTEHILQITELKDEVENTKKINAENEKLIEKYLEKICVLEEKLNDKIAELTCHLDKCQIEKKVYEVKIEENTKKVKSLEDSMEQSLRKLLDKEEEISRLQKEIKSVIKPNINEEDIKRTEEQLKQTLKELNDTKNNLKKTDELNKNLQTKILSLESKLAELENLQKKIIELKSINENLVSAIDKKEHEFHQFEKNRDGLVAGYESALKNMQNELNKAKREIVNLQTARDTQAQNEKEKFRAPLNDKAFYKTTRENKPPREKEDNTSDEEVIPERRGRRNRRVLEPPASPNIPEIQLSETSGSESKRTTRSTAKSTITCASSERKTTRRKKLYTHVDDSCIDVELPCEPLASPAPSARALRARRK